MGCDNCEALERKISELERDNAALRHQLHKYADELEKRQNTNWLVNELMRRCPHNRMGLYELVVYQEPKRVTDWLCITNNEPLQRVRLNEIKVCFYLQNFEK